MLRCARFNLTGGFRNFLRWRQVKGDNRSLTVGSSGFFWRPSRDRLELDLTRTGLFLGFMLIWLVERTKAKGTTWLIDSVYKKIRYSGFRLIKPHHCRSFLVTSKSGSASSIILISVGVEILIAGNRDEKLEISVGARRFKFYG